MPDVLTDNTPSPALPAASDVAPARPLHRDRDRTTGLSALAARPLDVADAERLAAVLKALAHPIRLRLFSLVANHPDGEACVCSISAGFMVSGPTISHHLRLLREASVVECQRRGSWVYYRAVPSTLTALAEIIAPPTQPHLRDRQRVEG